jgi:quinohemoprotein amine dehydrogenase
MARVGGANFPKQFQQFEAVAYSDGADGEADTDDDLNLGVVDVTWSLEEYSVTYDDDDIDFVGRIDGRGMFTPAEDGPNPNRSGNRNNVGDVWVVAMYDPGDGAETIVARAHLLVTVPLYIRFEPWRALQ